MGVVYTMLWVWPTLCCGCGLHYVVSAVYTICGHGFIQCGGRGSFCEGTYPMGEPDVHQVAGSDNYFSLTFSSTQSHLMSTACQMKSEATQSGM